MSGRSHTRRDFLKLIGMGSGMLPFSNSALGEVEKEKNDSNGKPNVVLILVDNIGYGDWGCYGNRQIMTPRINRLAAQGVRCTDFYIASPSCMPSRGALLTGRHPVRNGLNEQIWKTDSREQKRKKSCSSHIYFLLKRV